MKIDIGSDHAGFALKGRIVEYLEHSGHTVKDFGSYSQEPVDYPPIMRAAASAVAGGDCERGIVLGGSGNGEAIVANRIRGIRCALCWDAESARLARAHNNANMLSLGARLISDLAALHIVQIWLETAFDGGRHERRIRQIDEDLPPSP